ncbi:uncharacterized protein SAPINGB_P000098 [Magnusiomyces paraingens]|uniref:AB hydrolase-1 domain-containing protein n=1 Tax=Magnusiomyces paraingens TaxID=2606893 RepID=A0A5E8AYD8_9ASCO|nr:uncharacterized protein SAPINGB_P000098 [Saprochaete ingens]VVT43684.1 unnamed protein product [Saprochaete ingens]
MTTQTSTTTVSTVTPTSLPPPAMKYKRVTSEPENPFSKLVNNQIIAIVPEVELECGDVLHNVPVAYKTWGELNAARDNVMVICHALTGSSDVSDWWGPLLGPGRAFDPTKFFIICLNSLGSPYGSASPCTLNPDTGEYYGPEFPLVTVRDDVRIHRLILDDLGITSIAAVIGGSMGGMLVLEYAYYGPEYVRLIVPLATSPSHSAWGISWGETQRQSIYSDPKYNEGYYSFDDPPIVGLGAARMAAMLTYRSRNSFETKFGRKVPDPNDRRVVTNNTHIREPSSNLELNWALHNHGNIHGKKLASPQQSPASLSPSNSATSIPALEPAAGAVQLSPSPSSDADSDSNSTVVTSATVESQETAITQPSAPSSPVASTIPLNGPIGNRKKNSLNSFFAAQSYLRYQGSKFVQRFDANCYIAITRKLDSHDVSRGRGDDIDRALAMIKQPTLVIGISSDGLFTFSEQQRIAQHIPNAVLKEIRSPEGHDAFLLEFAEINRLIVDFLKEQLPDILNREGIPWKEEEIGTIGKSSLFGEAETDDLDVVSW